MRIEVGESYILNICIAFLVSSSSSSSCMSFVRRIIMSFSETVNSITFSGKLLLGKLWVNGATILAYSCVNVVRAS
jgi:hypothetical protein